MGYDVSFHPISPEEMQKWYFTPLTWVQQGQEEKVLALAVQHGIEDFYAEKYLDTLRVGAGTEPDELFDKSHGFYIAVIQGFFRDYYYTRGSGFSFLIEEKPEYARYFTSWEQVVPTAFPNPAENQIIENYCAGVYLSPKQVVQLLRNLEQDPKVCEDLERIWSNGQLAVLKKNWKAILAGIASGVLTSLLCVLALVLLFGLSHEEYVTLLPKSITTAIGIGISEELGGYVSITAAVIIITGVLGNVIGETILKIFRITEPVAKGVALGSASHAIGTAKAMELGEVEGAISSLSIVVSISISRRPISSF